MTIPPFMQRIPFSAGGKVGLWTKADSVVYFDDLTVTPL